MAVWLSESMAVAVHVTESPTFVSVEETISSRITNSHTIHTQEWDGVNVPSSGSEALALQVNVVPVATEPLGNIDTFETDGLELLKVTLDDVLEPSI